MSTNKIKELLDECKPDIYLDMEDVRYLNKFLKERNINLDCSSVELGFLYNIFSEECWSASWEDNAEHQFIEWLKEKEIISEVEDKTRLIDVDEMQELILDNISSKETDNYFSHMAFRENDLHTAFIQGMIYASILSAVKCKKYRV